MKLKRKFMKTIQIIVKDNMKGIWVKLYCPLNKRCFDQKRKLLLFFFSSNSSKRAKGWIRSNQITLFVRKMIKTFLKGQYGSNHIVQWCELTLAQRFWATNVCLRASKISQICLFGRPTGRATFWKANFENYSRYSLIKWYQFLSI